MEGVGDSESSQEIGFVYFDLGNVLFSFDPQTACENVAEKYGLDRSIVSAAVYGSGLQVDYESGHIRQEAFVRQVCVNLNLSGQKVSSSELLDSLSDMFSPIDSMLVAVKRIRSRGIPVGVLSNTCRSHWDWINRQYLSRFPIHFDSYVLSFEVGSMKPSTSIYEAAEHATEVAPERILFLDDRQENVAAAASRGWRAHCCVGGVDAESVLQSYGFGAG